MHNLIQHYFESLYSVFSSEINQTLCYQNNEIYGELYYYSIVKLLKYIPIRATDHFLDIGSGLGKLVFQIFLTTPAVNVTGIEINSARMLIAQKIKYNMQNHLPELFKSYKAIHLIESDFLTYQFESVTIVYVCSTVFSSYLLTAISEKINRMASVHTVISMRKLSFLSNFFLRKKIFLHGTWDMTACYIYEK